MPYTGAKPLNLVSQGKPWDEAQKHFSKLQARIPRSPPAAFPCLREQDTGLVWQQENGGSDHPSPFSLAHRDCRKPLFKEIKGGKKSRKGLDWAELDGREVVSLEMAQGSFWLPGMAFVLPPIVQPRQGHFWNML